MKNNGFTLIELLAVIAVLGIILAIAVPKVSSVIMSTKIDSFRVEAKELAIALENERIKDNTFNPTTINVDTLESELSINNDNYESLTVNIINDKLYVSVVGKNQWNDLSACGTKDSIVVEAGTVCNSDNTSPVITILGNNPAVVNYGSTYTDAGATALDDVDGDLTSSIAVTNDVNTSVLGHYTVTYRVTDTVGNLGTAVRDVYVVDNTCPVITVLGNNPATIGYGATYSDAGATATDDIDGDITSKITTTSTVNTNVIGTYTVTYTVADTAGNIGAASRTVNVVDTVIPTVAFGMNGNSTYAKSRSTTVTVSDNVSVNTSSLKYLWNTSTTAPTEGNFSTTFTNGSSISTPAGVTGTYYLWILGKDASGNTMIARSNAFNLDNTAPVITLLGSTPTSVQRTTTYTDAGATASDNINGNITASIVKTGTVNTSSTGTYILYYNVSDSAGNAATQVTRTVQVTCYSHYVQTTCASGHYESTGNCIQYGPETCEIYPTDSPECNCWEGYECAYKGGPLWQSEGCQEICGSDCIQYEETWICDTYNQELVCD